MAGGMVQDNYPNWPVKAILRDGVMGLLARSYARSPFLQHQLVTALYRALLHREPDVEGLQAHVAALRGGMSLETLLGEFHRSDEFLRKFRPGDSMFPLDGAPAMEVQTSYSDAERDAIWAHIGEVWSGFGETDPYWSVMVHEDWRAAKMNRAETLDAFYRTGEAHAGRMWAWAARNQVALSEDMVCAEYGCGVGRVTHVLARRFRRVIAFDISQPHLDAARARLTAQGITNVDYVLVRGPGDLAALAGVDVFFSLIVLQHNPPPIMLDILDRAFAGLRPGGVAFFQVPTYALGYSFSVARYFETLAKEATMEMHFLPQRMVLQAGRRHDTHPLEVQPDAAIDHHGLWISNAFLMRKGPD